jgi:hypothetical protein
MSAPASQIKAMLVLAHTADEAFDFRQPAAVSWRASDAVIVFLSSESRQAQQQAIEAMYSLGSRNAAGVRSVSVITRPISNEEAVRTDRKDGCDEWLIRTITPLPDPDDHHPRCRRREHDDGMSRLVARMC